MSDRQGRKGWRKLLSEICLSGGGDEVLLRGGDGHGNESLHVLVPSLPLLPLLVYLLGDLLIAPLLGPPDWLQLAPSLGQHPQINAGLGPHPRALAWAHHVTSWPRADHRRGRRLQWAPTQVRPAVLGHEEGLTCLVTAKILNQLEWQVGQKVWFRIYVVCSVVCAPDTHCRYPGPPVWPCWWSCTGLTPPPQAGEAGARRWLTSGQSRAAWEAGPGPGQAPTPLCPACPDSGSGAETLQSPGCWHMEPEPGDLTSCVLTPWSLCHSWEPLEAGVSLCWGGCGHCVTSRRGCVTSRRGRCTGRGRGQSSRKTQRTWEERGNTRLRCSLI